ncbi:class I SAM-dependent methyltransferase [Denitrificimonas sp. JX-1]|uniref:Ribosomal RNA small subunit methyltransferase J n=1 Tax=Denitrificimonas halotolerans TaxID=3098930 RepID=A0ABU5GUP2_9GAMM|nr:class I SAM-dependent methyltransferase [Denitrificimonas sp. JX-1]MDY7220362.1 class I SAM-dependent methyltransferase [Denitrificimonas sp. JX-1]
MFDSSVTTSILIRVDAMTVADQAQAVQLAQDLDLPLSGDADFALQVSADGMQLQELGHSAPGPIRVDFVEGALAHRRQFGGGSGQMIAKAVGIQSGVRPNILDATAGLGRDAFVLACLGCQVQMIERNPIVAVLLQDGLRRARLDMDIARVVQRMPLLIGDAIELMRSWVGEIPQVIHLDPMFPSREKSALVKKEMRLFKPLVGADEDAADLLAAALSLASHRVVVKRPRKAPTIEGPAPSYSLDGKSSRYDIYAKKSLKP